MEMKAFFQKFELQRCDARGTPVHQCGTFATEGRVVLVVDLDFFSTEIENFDNLKVVERWLDRAHDIIENAFVKSMSRDLYERLRRGEA